MGIVRTSSLLRLMFCSAFTGALVAAPALAEPKDNTGVKKVEASAAPAPSSTSKKTTKVVVKKVEPKAPAKPAANKGKAKKVTKAVAKNGKGHTRNKAAAKNAKSETAKGEANAKAGTAEPATPAEPEKKFTPRLAITPTVDKAPPRDCDLSTNEAPRGGQLEVKGQKFGSSPVVRVGNQVVRILRRERDNISVQIPANSNGGAVTVMASGQKQDCGALTIIGLDKD